MSNLNIYLIGFLIFVSSVTWADQALEKNWQAFKKQHDEWASSPTGYFAIQHMITLSPGETAFLVQGKEKKDFQWSKENDSGDNIKLSYSGQEATLDGPGIKSADLFKVNDKIMDLGNGLIVRVSPLHETQLKVWLYNPNLESRRNFKGLSFYPFNEDGVVRANLEMYETPQGVSYIDSREEKGTMYVVGKISFKIKNKKYSLKAYSYDSSWSKIQKPMIFITDLTSGKTTYGGGRVVEFDSPKKNYSEVVINFNKAYAFLCVHSKYYNCPIGLTSFLDTRLEYGEKLIGKSH